MESKGIMWNTPTEQELAALPGRYSTADTPAGDKIIVMHFFLAGFDWYAVKFDGRDTFFGFVSVHNDPASAERGYCSLSELREISLNGMEVDRGLFWKPVSTKDAGITPNS